MLKDRTDLERAYEHLSRPPSDLADPLGSMRAMVDDYAPGSDDPLPTGLTVEPVGADGVAAEWIIPAAPSPDRAVVYLHGGGWVAGSLRSHRRLAAELAVKASQRVLLVDYRLAPEHPFPAGLEDAERALAFAQRQGFSVTLAGDSAGGNLSAALTIKRLRDGAPGPDRLLLISPFLSPQLDLESRFAGPITDPVVTAEGIGLVAQLYAQGGSLTDPLIAPALCPPELLATFPPTLIQVSAAEALRDQALRFADALWSSGGWARLSLWPGMPHVWHAFLGSLPEADEACAEAAAFASSARG